MTIFDLSGDKDYEAAVKDYLNNLQIVLVCYSVIDKASVDEAERWLTKIVPRSSLKDAVIIVVGCKKDLTKQVVLSVHQKQDYSALGKALADTFKCDHFVTSSQNGENVPAVHGH